MKKTIAVMVLAAIATLTGACGSKNDSPKVVSSFNKDSSPINNGTLPSDGQSTATTSSTDTAAMAACASEGAKLGNEWNGLADTLTEAVNQGIDNDPEVMKAAADAVRRGIVLTRNWISSCRSYYPETAQKLTTITDSMESMVAGY